MHSQTSSRTSQWIAKRTWPIPMLQNRRRSINPRQWRREPAINSPATAAVVRSRFSQRRRFGRINFGRLSVNAGRRWSAGMSDESTIIDRLRRAQWLFFDVGSTLLDEERAAEDQFEQASQA